MSPVSEITPAGAVKEVLGSGGGSAIMGSVSSAGVILAGTGFSVTRLSAGQYAITFNNPFLTTPVINVTMADPTGWRNVSGGAVVFGVAAGSATPYGFTAIFEYPAGTFQDTPFFFIASSGVSLAPSLMSDKTIGGSVSATGTILYGTGFTVNKTGTGSYVINFTVPFPSAPVVLVSCTDSGGGAQFATIGGTGPSPTSVTVYTLNTGAAADRAFDFVATLGFTYSPTTLLGKMINGIIAGNGAISAGSGFTCVRNSAGNYTITFSTPFPTAPIVTATVTDGSVNRFCAITTVSTTGFTVIVNSSAGTSFDQAFNFTVQDPNLAVASSTLPAVPSAMTLICDSGPIPSQAVFDTQTILGGPIPQIYKHLKLLFESRTDSTTGVLKMLINNDSGTNYRVIGVVPGGGAWGAAAAYADLSANSPWCHSGSPAEIGSAIDINFFDYAQAVYRKRFSSAGIFTYSTVPQAQNTPTAGNWNSIAAIQRLALSLSAGNFTEARFSLYGI